MAVHQIPPDSLAFPLDGEDTLDAVSIVSPNTDEVTRFPRLWQTPDGVIDVNDVLFGPNDERARLHQLWILDYYAKLEAFTGRLAKKWEPIIAAMKVGNQRQVKRLLADLTCAERAYIDETLREILDEHPEWALADAWDVDV